MAVATKTLPTVLTVAVAKTIATVKAVAKTVAILLVCVRRTRTETALKVRTVSAVTVRKGKQNEEF